MIKLTCKHCKQEVVVPLYFYDIRILVEDNPNQMNRDYTASALGKAICPDCGYEIHEHCKCPITLSDIEKLATRRYIQCDSGINH